MAVATELVTEFSYQGSEAPLNRYNQSLNSSITLLASMTAALVAAGAAVGKWASGVLEGERDLFNLSYTTGIAIEKIQQLSFTAEMMGSSSQAMQSSLESLSATLGDAAQKGSEDFARLGIAVRDANGEVRSADDVLFDIQRRFKQLNLSISEQQSFAGALGIDTSLLRMLGQTDEQMALMMQRASELGTLNEEQSKQAEQYNKALVAQRFAMDGLRRLIAVGLAPELTRLTEGLVGLIERNREWIIIGVQHAMGILNDFMETLGRVWPVLAAGAGVLVALKIATLGWAGALGALLSPAVLIAAGIATILLVIDDLIVAFRGGDSVIRDFFLTFFDFDIQPVLQGIVDGFLTMVESIKIRVKGLWDFMKGLFAGIGQLFSGNFAEGFDEIKQAFQGLWDSIKEAFLNVFGGLLDWAKDAITGLLPGWAQKLLGLDSDSGQPVGDASMRPGGSQTQNNRSSNINQEVQINVRSNDPERAAQLTADALQRQLDDAQTQADRGGR